MNKKQKQKIITLSLLLAPIALLVIIQLLSHLLQSFNFMYYYFLYPLVFLYSVIIFPLYAIIAIRHSKGESYGKLGKVGSLALLMFAGLAVVAFVYELWMELVILFPEMSTLQSILYFIKSKFSISYLTDSEFGILYDLKLALYYSSYLVSATVFYYVSRHVFSVEGETGASD